MKKEVMLVTGAGQISMAIALQKIPDQDYS